MCGISLTSVLAVCLILLIDLLIFRVVYTPASLSLPDEAAYA